MVFSLSSCWHQGQRQHGGATLMGVALIAAIALTLSLGWSHRVAQQGQNRQDHDRQQYLNDAHEALLSWYQGQAAVIDARSDALSELELLNAIAPLRRWPLRAASSVRLGLPCQNQGAPSCVAWHVFTVWLPPVDVADTTSFNAQTGVLSPGPQVLWKTVTGRNVQVRMSNQTLADMDRLGLQLQQYFHTRTLLDRGFDRHRNYFRPEDCNAPQLGDLPCFDVYTPLGAANLGPLLGLEGYVVRNAWGGSVDVSTLKDASASIPPYTLMLQTLTPWGNPLQMTVVQPM